MIRVLLADDHPLVLDGLEQLLRLEDDLELVGRAADGEEALRLLHELRPDVLVLDLAMPRVGGIEVLRRLAAEGDATGVVVLTAGIDEDDVLEAVRLGVRGLVLKEMAPRLLVECIRRVHAGERWLERDTLQRSLDRLLAGTGGPLSPREVEIVRLTARGIRNRDIAEQLFIGEATVKTHLHRIYQKLGIEGRVALANYARDKGLS